MSASVIACNGATVSYYSGVLIANGRRFVIPNCDSVMVNGGQIIIDGKVFQGEGGDGGKAMDWSLMDKIELHLHLPRDAKNTMNFETRAGTVIVDGSVGGTVRSTSGRIQINQGVQGSVSSTSGNVTVGGNVGGSGDVDIRGDVHGPVTTVSGDIRH